MTDYTPSTSEVRAEYFSTRDHTGESAIERAKQFDRWLAEHDRQTAEKAWGEGARAGYRTGMADSYLPDNPYRKDTNA